MQNTGAGKLCREPEPFYPTFPVTVLYRNRKTCRFPGALVLLNIPLGLIYSVRRHQQFQNSLPVLRYFLPRSLGRKFGFGEDSNFQCRPRYSIAIAFPSGKYMQTTLYPATSLFPDVRIAARQICKASSPRARRFSRIKPADIPNQLGFLSSP